MKLQRPKTRAIKIQVFEVEASKLVRGTSHSVQVFETTSDEVFDLIKGLLVSAAEDGACAEPEEAEDDE